MKTMNEQAWNAHLNALKAYSYLRATNAPQFLQKQSLELIDSTRSLLKQMREEKGIWQNNTVNIAKNVRHG